MADQPLRVLVVDDNRGDCVLIEQMLRNVCPDGFEVRWVGTFKEGLTAMLRNGVDVYLVDFRLGEGKTGLDFLELAIAQECDAPIILLTGQSDAEVDREASRLGAADYLEKDRLDGRLLERAIRYALERKEMERRLRQVQEELEQKVRERTAHLEAANRQLQAEIRHRERVETQLQQVQKLDAVGRVVSGVAHDFNNYLGVMRGYLEMSLKAIPRENATRRYLLNVLQAVNASSRLVRQLLAFSSRNPVEKQVLDVNLRVRDLEKLLTRVLGEHIDIRLALCEKPWLTLADLSSIDQVIMNLAVNARDAMPTGGTLRIETHNVTVDAAFCERFPQAVPGDFVRLRISDTGVGMPDEVLTRLFEPFFTTKGPQGGTGLGLSMVYGIVRSHGGWLVVESVPGKGCYFDIYLPAEKSAVLPTEKPVEPGAAKFVGGHGESILVVEDDPLFGEMIREALMVVGYHVTLCGTVREASDFFQRRSPDLMLSDLVLPDGRGSDLAAQFSQSASGQATLLMTGYPDEWEKRDAFEKMGWLLLQKPMPIDVLLLHIQTALARRW